MLDGRCIFIMIKIIKVSTPHRKKKFLQNKNTLIFVELPQYSFTFLGETSTKELYK